MLNDKNLVARIENLELNKRIKTANIRKKLRNAALTGVAACGITLGAIAYYATTRETPPTQTAIGVGLSGLTMGFFGLVAYTANKERQKIHNEIDETYKYYL